MVFATAMLVQKDSLRDAVKRCKALGKRVVLGGPYVTTTIEDLPEADHIFLGEAETTLPQFVADLERGEAKRTYQAAEKPPLSVTPIADFHLADLKRYSAMSVQYSRGCPFSCEFCDIIEIYGRVPRTKSNQQMLAELDALKHLGGAGQFSSWMTISSATKRMSGSFCRSWPSGRKKMAIRFRCLPKPA